MRIYAFGHKNIQATHRTTLEITKDPALTRKGNCIIGINSDFDSKEIKEFIKDKDKIKMILEIESLRDEISFVPNKDFDSKHEIVIRLSDFASDRTLGIKADKSSAEISRKMIEKMKKPASRIKITLK